MQKDAIKSSTLVTAMLSSANLVEGIKQPRFTRTGRTVFITHAVFTDKDLLVRANDVILYNLERVKPRSLQTTKYYTSTLKTTMEFMSDRIPKDNLMTRMTEAVSTMTTQMSHLVETDGEWQEDPFIDLFSTIGLGVKDASVMSRNAETTSESLFNDLAKLITVFHKPIGEFPTVIRGRSIDLDISNARMASDSSYVHRQQYGVAFIGDEQEETLPTIQVGTAKFPFNPMVYSRNNNLSNDTEVVGLVLIGNSSGNPEGRQVGRYRPVSRSTTMTILRRKRLHILLPSPNNTMSTSVRLPQPCPGSNNTDNTLLSRSRSEACGYTLINFSVENGRGKL